MNNTKQIQCRVVKVDEKATQCQRVGNAFIVDESLGGILCARARERMWAAAEQMRIDGELASGERDVSCPDNHVVYRISFVTETMEELE